MTKCVKRQHEELVRNLAKPGDDIAESMTPTHAHMLHMAIGVAGEAGELLDAVKKHVIYQKPLDLKNVVEELGDLEFYMQGIREALGVSRDIVLTTNIAKLNMRYAEGRYSNDAAQARADKQ